MLFWRLLFISPRFPGRFLNFASRLQRYYAALVLRKDPAFYLKKKYGAFVYAAGGDTKDMSCALRRVKIISRQMNTELVDVVGTDFTNDIPANKDIAALKKAKEIAEKLNNLYEKQQG